MPISWNEIRHNAVAFSRDWASVSREDAEAKTFWDEFFGVFGIKRRTVASFEEPVKRLSGSWGYIDLFWPGTLLVEHKSMGKSLDKAETQAMEYIHALKNARRDDEVPRYLIVSDFARIALHDLDNQQSTQIDLCDLHANIHKFAFIPGYQQHKLDDQDPVNIQAVELLGELHDSLEAGGYRGHDLERFLVRVLFCLFAEKTGLTDRSAFTLFIENHTEGDGSDLGAHLARLFQVLNTPTEARQRNLLEELADLPYVNGDLFDETLGFADFNRDMRNRLLACCRFDWSRISPAVFGSLFQSVMEPRERRQVGAHYTSERDILKLVRSLFLDDLRAEFERLKSHKGTQRTARLKEFHERLGSLKFLDPACGCGNFLVVTYRELRLLEIEVLKLRQRGQKATNVELLSFIDVDAMYGIEINEFPAQIAQVALWLVDHQMNQRLSEAFGQYFVRLPLKKSAGCHWSADFFICKSASIPLNRTTCYQTFRVPLAGPVCLWYSHQSGDMPTASRGEIVVVHRKLVKHVHEPGPAHEFTFSYYRRRPLLTNDDWRWSSARFYLLEPPKQQLSGLPFVHGIPHEFLD